MTGSLQLFRVGHYCFQLIQFKHVCLSTFCVIKWLFTNQKVMFSVV